MLRFVVDNFANEIGLSIEIDGGYHNERSQNFYDEDRTENLTLNEITVIRFSNAEVIFTTDEVVEKIRQKIIELRERKKTPPPSR